MHGEFRHLRFGVKRLEPAERRLPRDRQRELAASLETALGPGWRLTSRSHSRGVAAVAVGNPPVTRLGIDVEYVDLRRPWREIAAHYLYAPPALGPPALCRLWTFGEAFFKAFAAIPSPDLLLRIADAPLDDDEPFAFASRRWWWSEEVGEGFMLSLVWEEAL